jgi:3-phytase
MNLRSLYLLPLGIAALASTAVAKPGKTEPAPGAVRPRVVTEAVKHDTDDPAIWINRANPAESLVLGTDKHADGALYVFGLDGKIRRDLVVRGLVRPNNVDIAYDLMVGGRPTDIAVVTERYAHRLRVYRLPDLAPIDGGGLPIFAGEAARDGMGVALYTRPRDGAVFAIASRAPDRAPTQGYLHQYRLIDDGTGTVRAVFTRAFGAWSGKKEIEAITVDQELGYVYYSDENFGLRKYLADPAAEDAEDELAAFGRDGFAEDREGISIFPTGPGRGYVLVSDQQANALRVFPREGTPGRPHEHQCLFTIDLTAIESDGSEVTPIALPGFPGGLFVAMTNGRVFHFYAWDDLKAAMKRPTPSPSPAR